MLPHGDIGATCVPSSGCLKVDVCVVKTLISDHIDCCQSTVREKLLLAGIQMSWWHFQRHCAFQDVDITLFFCPQIIDEDDTQFMTNCAPAVTESTPRRRTRIQVFWTAPPTGTGCVILKCVCMLFFSLACHCCGGGGIFFKMNLKKPKSNSVVQDSMQLL